jgi:hypothetical protein
MILKCMTSVYQLLLLRVNIFSCLIQGDCWSHVMAQMVLLGKSGR